MNLTTSSKIGDGSTFVSTCALVKTDLAGVDPFRLKKSWIELLFLIRGTAIISGYTLLSQVPN